MKKVGSAFFPTPGVKMAWTQNPETTEEKIKHFSHLKMGKIYKAKKPPKNTKVKKMSHWENIFAKHLIVNG